MLVGLKQATMQMTTYPTKLLMMTIQKMKGMIVSENGGNGVTLRDVYIKKFNEATTPEQKKRVLKQYALNHAINKYSYRPNDFKLVNKIWTQESQWDWRAKNPETNAYGIAQMITKSRITDPFKQIDLGLKYIDHRYGSAKAAYAFKIKNGWY